MSRRVAWQLEEAVNTATHAVGLLASLAIFPVLIQFAARRGDGLVVLGTAIFGMTLVAAYATSTMYHSVEPGPKKDLWLRLDYTAIYLLIAGTYTPFALGALRGPWGWSLLALVWGGAILGICAKMRFGPRYPALSTIAYLLLGWLALIAINPLLRTIGWSGLGWLIAGGVAYSVGVIFFACDGRMRFGHCAWHLFAMVGSACHVIAITGY